MEIIESMGFALLIISGGFIGRQIGIWLGDFFVKYLTKKKEKSVCLNSGENKQ